MRQQFKVFLLSVLTGSLVTTSVFIAHELLLDGHALESARFTSLGIPKIVAIDKSKGEQKVIFNDPSIQKNWGLIGQGGIKANRAWDITQGDRQIVVAIIDTGIDLSHPDLASNIWKNPGETGFDSRGRNKSTNGVDDDRNGYIDDVSGWDFVNNKPTVEDNHGHGTHIAGIVGASGDNTIVGTCPRVSIMALKYFDPSSKGNDNLKNTIRAIRYAADMGARIINYSGGGTEPNDDEFGAIRYAQQKGILFVAAAGNEQSNSDHAPYYPADYNLSNIISVTAVDNGTNILKTSNYGSKSVHIAAPGNGIKSTLPRGNYGLMTGTSQATAFVSGVAALISSKNKEFNFDQIKNQIIQTADEVPGLKGKTLNGGRLNSYAALAIQPNIPATGIPAFNPKFTAGIVDNDRNTEPSNNATLLTFIKALKNPVADTNIKPDGRNNERQL